MSICKAVRESNRQAVREVSHRDLTWAKVCQLYNKRFGTNLARQSVVNMHDKIILKVREDLEGDPDVRDYLESCGLVRPKD